MPIRTLEYADLDALLALYEHLFVRDDPPPARAQLEAIWSRFVSNPALRCLGLEGDGQLIATCTLSVIPNLTRGGRSYAQIENVVTHKAFRRQGYGKAVITRAIELARQDGCYKVMLLTGKLEVHTFYESCGFRKDLKTGFVISWR
jgi:GNAT superfamily N-acetyltransferase